MVGKTNQVPEKYKVGGVTIYSVMRLQRLEDRSLNLVYSDGIRGMRFRFAALRRMRFLCVRVPTEPASGKGPRKSTCNLFIEADARGEENAVAVQFCRARRLTSLSMTLRLA